MTNWTYDASLSHVLTHEGGYTNNPHDPGGPTNFGITIYDARKYAAEYGWITGRRVTAVDVRAMPLWFAKKVYKAKYWDAQRCDDLPAGVDYAVFDYGVNSGIGRSKKVLQRAVGVKDDGVIGPATLAAVAARKPEAIIDFICAERLAFLKRLRTWPVFGKGWGRRVAEVRMLALDMAAHTAEHPADAVAKVKAKAAAAPPTPPIANVYGKGVVPLPTVAKAAVAHKDKIAAASTVGGGGFAVESWAWIHAHPIEACALAAGGVLIIGGAGYAIESAHRRAQEAPVVGITPVAPAKAA